MRAGNCLIETFVRAALGQRDRDRLRHSVECGAFGARLTCALQEDGLPVGPAARPLVGRGDARVLGAQVRAAGPGLARRRGAALHPLHVRLHGPTQRCALFSSSRSLARHARWLGVSADRWIDDAWWRQAEASSACDLIRS